MKRSAFTRKETHKGFPAPRSPLSRGKGMKRVGKKTLAWSDTRAKLKVRFEEAGITTCERCGINDCLSFAHRFKRNKINTQSELETVVLLCMPPSSNDCHGHYERMSHEDMYHGLTRIIEARERQP